MNASWYAHPGAWAYGLAAAAFLSLSVRLIARWHPGGKPAMLLAMATGTALTAAVSVVFLAVPTVGVGWVTALLDFVRVSATIGFLLAFLGVSHRSENGTGGGHGWARLVGLAVLLLVVWLLVGVKPPGFPDHNPFTRQLGFGSALGVAAFGLVLVEQCYRRTPPGSRWHVRPLVIAFAGLFAYDLALYSDALLFQVLDGNLWAARGFAQAITVPLILATLRRRSDWSFELSVSRGVVAGSTALLLTGSYLLLVASAGFLLRETGGSWGRALESALLFAALLLLAVLVASRTLRAKLSVFLAKHFFSYRYDYREEWLRLTNTLGAMSAARPWAACIQALGDLVESPGGALWFRKPDGTYGQIERADFPRDDEVIGEKDPLPTFLHRTGWVIDIAEALTDPSKYQGLRLPPQIANVGESWVVVPLFAAQQLTGFVVLTRPRVRIDLDWEVLDLLKTAGRQAASYLAHAQATDALLEAQKFDAFHRMSTFVVHDLKNLIAQLQLLLSNAERHRDNPDFQRDMLRTIEHVVARMHQLTLQLRPEASAHDSPRPVDVGATLRRVQSLHSGGRAGLRVEGDEGILALAHEDLLERVISHLVQNAFEASEGQPDVTATMWRDAGGVVIEVRDRGKGMTRQFLRERLFKPFQTTKATGLGIGAYECQQYVQRIGGQIDVASAPGKGTIVRLRLPAVAPAAERLDIAV